MAWVSLLAKVPWTEVLKNAPAVAEAARKFWNKTRTPASTDVTGLAEHVDAPAAVQALQQAADPAVCSGELGCFCAVQYMAFSVHQHKACRIPQFIAEVAVAFAAL